MIHFLKNHLIAIIVLRGQFSPAALQAYYCVIVGIMVIVQYKRQVSRNKTINVVGIKHFQKLTGGLKDPTSQSDSSAVGCMWPTGRVFDVSDR